LKPRPLVGWGFFLKQKKMGQIEFKRGKQSQKVPSVNFKVAGLCFDMDTTDMTTHLLEFTSTDRVRALYSLEDAKALGINNKHADETVATGGKITIGETVGAIGDTYKAYIKPVGVEKKILLGSYTVTKADRQTIANGLGSAINSNKSNHMINGVVYPFVATVDLTTPWAINLTAPAGLGASINATVLTVDNVSFTGGAGTGTSTIAQFSGGIGSRIAVLYHHVKEFYRLCPTGKLYVGLFDNASGVAGDYVHWEAGALVRMQNYAEGEIKRFGSWTETALTGNSELTVLASSFHTVYQQLLQSKRYAESILTCDNYTTPFALGSLTDQRANDFDSVTIDIGNSGSGEGWRLLGVVGKTIGTTGAWLGVRSEIPCNHSVGSRALAVLVGDGEHVSCAFSNGKTMKEIIASSGANLITQLEAFGFLFTKQYQDDSKSVFCTDNNCGTNTGDYTESKNLETWHKVARLVNLNEVPIMESQLFIDTETGEISYSTKSALHTVAYAVLEDMGKDGEISTNADGQVPYDSIEVSDFVVDNEIRINISFFETETLKKITNSIGFATKK
jgi:hypothetical protein